MQHTSSRHRKTRAQCFLTHNLLVPLQEMHRGCEYAHRDFGTPPTSLVSTFGCCRQYIAKLRQHLLLAAAAAPSTPETT